ncbi:aldo/keto reductase [Methylibium rhizosphaerae]|uniref:aldo/keto reductase n=1 Tax=Methylibium rhizosphaerae TaxID=2570323 RepID=UPI0011293AF5|nr:aldo/keto reductase [Methylibium rhizosphaerae]
MKHVSLPGGEKVPALGLGTWRMGESARTRAGEVAAVREAIEMGYRLIDTAEMYGEGGAESVVGEALRGAVQAGDVRREELFIVSKVYPHNASRAGTVAACERSLARLGLDHIDLYLLHWRGSHPLRETVEGFEALRARQSIRHWGVSNCDVDDLQELWPVSGACAANQVWYSMSQRGVEFDLLPWQRERGVPLMAYSPIDQAELARNIMLAELGLRRGITAAQLALAWTLRDGGVIAIPKAVKTEHLRANLAAADVQLDRETLAALDTAFPPPKRRQPLAVN